MTDRESAGPWLIPLELRPAEPIALMGPALAAVAGALASGRLAADATSLVTLALAVLLADPLLGGLWRAVSCAGWAGRWEATASAPERTSRLPHAVHGSLAHRVSVVAGRLASRSPGADDGGMPFAVLRAVFYLAALLAVAAALGAETALLVVAAAALAWLQCLLGHVGWPVRWPESVAAFAVAWLVGFAAFGRLPLHAADGGLVFLAVAWTVAYHGYRGLAAGDPPVAGLVALDGGQAAALLGLVAAGKPWQAALVGLFLAAQALGQPALWRGGDRAAYLRGSLMFIVLAVLVTFM